MTHRELKERLDALLDELPEDKASLLLDFAAFLRQQAETAQPVPANGWELWEQAIIAAEEYWFGLPEAARHSYGNKIVAVVAGRILDADTDSATLLMRVQAGYPDQPILYIEAQAERLPPLTFRSPRLG